MRAWPLLHCYQFETVSRMSEHEQEMVRELLDAIIVKNQVAGALERVNKPTAKEKKPTRERSGAKHERVTGQ